jgi:predicted metal-dependent phosphoesterase TrpH
MEPEKLLKICRERGIDRVAVTDHNTISGARECAAIDPQMVIIGEEIMTTQGELLGYFLHEQVPAGLPPAKAIEILREQGAFISVSHPLDRARSGSWAIDNLRAILPLVDAIEVFNSRTLSNAPNTHAQMLAREVGMLGTIGSDAHHYSEVGKSVIVTNEFTDAEGMKEALRHAELRTVKSSPLVHFYSRFAVWRKSLKS